MRRAILFCQSSCKGFCGTYSRYYQPFLVLPNVYSPSIIQNRPNVILSKTQSNLHTLGGELAYVQYVRHLEKTSPFNVARNAPGGLTVESFGRGYEDYLQAPLQVNTNTSTTW
jgi:hypothetical protein